MIQKYLNMLSSGQYRQVHQEAIALIHENVSDPVPYYLLALIAQDHGNFAKALELAERATDYGPKDPRYIALQGQLHSILQDPGRAKLAADKAASFDINDAFVADTVGVLYSRTGFHELAIPQFQRAVRLNPDPANFHYNLGISLQFSGAFDAAEAAFHEALKRDPDLYKAHTALVSLRKQTLENNRLEKLIAIFEDKEADATLQIGHAITKTLEDLGRHEDSLDWLIRAKTKKRAEIGHHSGDDMANFKAAQTTCGPLPALSTATSSHRPIFITGLPRTGTTLVDRIISSHPEVTSAGELNTFAGLIKSAAATTSNFVMDAATLTKAASLDLAPIGDAYLRETAELARKNPVVTDKMPFNFFYAALILRALPDAKVIVLRRSAMDSCLSNFRQLFSAGYSYYNYTLDLGDTAQFYRGFDDLISFWQDQLPSDRFTTIQYEELVRHQEHHTRRLLDFCDLEWNEACLNFHENDAPVSTASSVQVRQPIHTGSIGRWKKYGNKLDGLREKLGSLAD